MPRFLCGLLACLFALPGCQKPETKASAEKPAKVDHVLNEAEINVVELSEAAERRLKIATAEVDERELPRQRTYGATLVLPSDASVVVSAPLAGTVHVAPRHAFPIAGQSVKTGDPLIELLPMLSPERAVLTPSERVRLAEAKNALSQARIEAQGQLDQADVQVEAAKIALARAERLLREQAGTVKAVDDAKAQLQLAEKTFAAAESRKTLVDDIHLDEDAGTLSPLTIPSPLTGLVRVASVRPGEIVAPAAPLFEVMDDAVLWVKVAVYVGEIQEIDAGKPARVAVLDGRVRSSDSATPLELMAAPLAAPPTADPQAAAVDLYYRLPNPERQFRPGEKVAAHLTLHGEPKRLTVPWASVWHDVYGGQWVYVHREGRRYARQRIEVDWVAGDRAVLLRGPEAGTRVVTAGVAELAGTEFGFAK